MERKLASIQSVVSVEPIEGADRIEKIQVLGWRLVAKKGDFRPGDLCVYFEIDSLLPESPEFEFLRERKFRIRTMKMRGAISQGLAMPLSVVTDTLSITLDEIADENGVPLQEGDDVTELIGVKKYEPPIPMNLSGEIFGTFPTHLLPKTDEQRLQSAPGVLEEIKDKTVYVTAKMDGTSATYYLGPDGHFGVCSRNWELKPDDANVLWQLAKKYDIETTLRAMADQFGYHLAVQGEACGPGIAGNRMQLKEHRLFVFNVYSIDRREYWAPEFIGSFSLVMPGDLEGVPLLDILVPEEQPKTVDEWLVHAERFYQGQSVEGIVVRSMREEYSPTLQGRLSFKVVSNRYLLEHGE